MNLDDYPYHFGGHLGRDRDPNEIDLRLHDSLYLHFLFPDDWMAKGNDIEEKVLQTRQRFVVGLTFQAG